MRLLGYYNIKQGILQQNLSKYYRFERVDTLCENFKRFINTLKKQREQKEPKECYPWLDSNNEGKCMTDQVILDKYIDLENSCLIKEVEKEVMEIMYKYKEAFNLRDEIGTCPIIEVECNMIMP